MNDPFNNLYSIIFDSAIKQNYDVDMFCYPSLGDNNPLLLGRTNPRIELTTSDAWVNLSRRKIIFHDQEPMLFNQYDNEWATSILKLNRIETRHLLSNSEINSSEKSSLLEATGWKDFYWFSNGFLALEWYRHYRYATYLERSFSPRYLFSCYNRIIKDRPHRREIANELLKLGKDRIILSCTGDHSEESNPIVINTADTNRQNLAHTIFTEDFTDSFCHVITERLFNEDRIHLTEKTFRPLVCCRPFIMVSSPGSLAYLRSYGFKTFDGFWDESYDQITDHDQRLIAIKKLIHDISHMDTTKLLSEMESVLVHNRTHFYGQFQQLITDELYRNLYSALDDTTGRDSYFKRIIEHLTEEELSLVKSSDDICSIHDDNAYEVYKTFHDSLMVPKPASGIRDYVRENIKYITPFYFSLIRK